MTFLAPGLFFASLAVAAAIVALHFIVTRQPRAAILPTARFVPDTRATIVARARRPSDWLVMLLRVLLVFAAGAGLAKPVFESSRATNARVILVDVSRSARDSIAIRDSVQAFYRDRDAVIAFDSSARLLIGSVADTLGVLRPTSRRGNLSAALTAAHREGSRLRDRADSLELVIVSPFAKEEFDAATDTIRRLWPGKARLVRVGVSEAETPSGAGKLQISADASDPLSTTVALARDAQTVNGLIDRGSIDDSTSSTTAERQKPRTTFSRGALVEWPASTRPRFAVQRTVRDTVGGVVAGDAVVVSAFDRRWSFPADSLRDGEVIARWVDGEPAAVEKPDGSACLRSVAVPVSPVGDLVIRRDFVRFVASMSGPCAATRSLVAADPSLVTRLEGSGGLAPRKVFQPLNDAHSALAPWLLALAIASAVAELFVRRRRKDSAALGHADQRSASGEARAA